MSEAFRTTIDIEAEPDRVFDHLVRPELLVRWMGDVARLEARDGGAFSVDINGVLIRGHFLRVERPRLIFIGRLAVLAGGGDPGPDPWKTSSPVGGVQSRPPQAS